MDISNAKKVNDLALDLVKQGFASSSAEAYEMAKKTIEKDVKNEPSVPNNRNIIEKIELELERRNRAFVNEMHAIKNQIKDIESNVLLLKNDIKSLEKIEVKGSASKVDEVRNNGFRKYSEYDPEDVSVDKMFYFGKNGNR